MLLVPNPLNVFAVQGVTDMRKSFSGLVGLVETQLGQQVESGHLFLFFNRRRNSVKVLYFVGDGLVIYYRRLERGTFELPQRMRASATSIEPPAATAKPRRRTPKRFVFPEGLPCRRTEHPLDTAELPCSCCQQPRVVIGTHVSRQLELEPAHAYVVEHVRYTYACAKCRSGQALHTTAKPSLPIEKSPFGPSVLAAISVDKYARHLPLYRQQESLLGPLQTWLSRSLLCRLLRGVAEAVNYALNRWPTLVRNLDDGDLSIDTNHVEREIRPLAIGRTNWLFLGHERAGATASALYTVLQSARLQQVDLLPYLTDVLRGLPAVERGDVAGVDVYLPDRWLAAHPQHCLIERERESQDAQRRRRLRHAARRAGTAG